ncbi:MAG TPA: hypothetical protein DEO91_04915 [Pseudomonas sp.]|uniref:hypothetical protein n=1 Tax=Pseudomonas sp. UBA6323 TaxID=1947329 RepID=UPI000EDCBB6E|nr:MULTISPECIES: hypothetical protein [Pseudomonas]MBH3337979.1 hypothetical protein [Pseudomonas mendocina]HBZ93048.1 hypothetical protein [Pseudomonas sp.]
MLLRRLFNRSRPVRHFALIDAQGLCRALRQMHEHPGQAGWVEVHEPSITWLGAPLPGSARITPVVTHARAARPLAA